MRRGPLSFAQERLWFAEQLRPGTPAFNIPSVFEIDGPLDLHALEGAVADVVGRHDILRAQYRETCDSPVQELLDHVEVPLTVIDLPRVADPGTVDAIVADTARHEAARPFHLGTAPLLRTTALRLRPDRHVFLLTMHHLISDEWSVRIFCSEIAERYGARLSGAAPDVAPLPVQYQDYARSQRRGRAGRTPTGTPDTGLDRLDGVAAPALPAPPGARRADDRGLGERETADLEHSSLATLRAAAVGAGATFFMALVGVTGVVLGGLCAQEDILIGCPTSGRVGQELETLIGCFVNTLAVRLDLSGDPSFGQVLGRARSAVLAARSHEEIPFEHVVRGLRRRQGGTGQDPLRVWLSYDRAVRQPVVAGLAFRDTGVDAPLVRHDLRVGFSETASGLRITLDFRPSVVDPAFVDRLAGGLARTIAHPPAGPTPLSAVTSELAWSASSEHRASRSPAAGRDRLVAIASEARRARNV